eukprot:1157247-Pelagomonas_calceolata.AAC.5
MSTRGPKVSRNCVGKLAHEHKRPQSFEELLGWRRTIRADQTTATAKGGLQKGKGTTDTRARSLPEVAYMARNASRGAHEGVLIWGVQMGSLLCKPPKVEITRTQTRAEKTHKKRGIAAAASVGRSGEG